MGDYYGITGGSGSGGEDTNVHTIWFEKNGGTYATGGISVDLASTFSSVGAFDVKVVKGTRGNVPFGRFEKSISGTTITFKIMKERFDRITGVGNVQNQPTDVTVLASSGGTSSSESSHTHDATHDHASATSAAMTAAGAGQDTGLGGNMTTHTHPVDVPSMAVTTGAGSSHNHTDNTIYDHKHAETHTATNYAITELANSTSLTATTFSIVAIGQRA